MRNLVVVVFGALMVAGLFNLSPNTAYGHCAGKHTGDHPHCDGGDPPVVADPAIAYIFRSKIGARDLMVMDADGANQTAIVSSTKFPPLPWTPGWAPDANKIIYAMSSCFNITERDVSGQWSEPATLFCQGQGVSHPAWHPDDSGNFNRIAYVVDPFEGDASVAAINLIEFSPDGVGGYNVSEPSNLFTEERSAADSPSWSFDGTKIAFNVLKDENDVLSEQIIVLDLTLSPNDPDYRTELTVPGHVGVTILGGLEFGKTHNLLVVSADEENFDGDIWCINVDDPSDVTNLTDALDQIEGDRMDSDPSWSPDDGAIVFLRSGVAKVMNVDTSAGCPVTATSVTEIATPKRGGVFGKLEWRR